MSDTAPIAKSVSVVGIDLGTSNSVLAHAEATDGEAPVSGIFAIPQVCEVGQTQALEQLPSFLYLPGGEELPEGAIALPWSEKPRYAIGTFAREHGGKVPHRLVHSAKSWLCHDGVDRRAKILPHSQGDEAVKRVSPLQASGLYLLHMRRAWEHAGRPPMAEQEVVLTVPASFDPAARDLTLEAARAAGLSNVALLEEPQAALYAWLEATGESWRDQLSLGDTVLVCDVGGGTTDFSLITVGQAEGSLQLERIAVGEHILLGGDNMDWALAYTLKAEIEKDAGKKLDSWQLTALMLGCRSAKESLLNRPDVDSVPVVIPSRGSKLFAKTLEGTLTRERIYQAITEGFFPTCALSDSPRAARRGGLTAMGLPYASDAAITRHLAAFLSGSALPTAVLFNGGVLKADPLRQRLTQVINGWLDASGKAPITVLDGGDMDRAVARGAAYYGCVRKGRGVRIKSGTARSYYVGVEQPMPAVPGFEPPVMAICVAAFGMEEGTEAGVPGERLAVIVGEPARFRFFAAADRGDDIPGTVIEDWESEGLVELPPIEAELPPGEGSDAGQLVEVGLASAVTTTGTLALHCVALDESARQWKLELAVRGDEAELDSTAELDSKADAGS